MTTETDGQREITVDSTLDDAERLLNSQTGCVVVSDGYYFGVRPDYTFF
jgi:hypothetical protein